MSYRRNKLETGEVHHVFSKSIMGFEILRNDDEYLRMKSLISYYMVDTQAVKFSTFEKIRDKGQFLKKHFNYKDILVKIISYCFMPTHIHLILKQEKDNGVSIFMNNILNSYSRYFNTKIKRKGPLWESRFKNVKVETNDQLSHLTRYLHLNPVTAYLVKAPEDWRFSSYNEFLGKFSFDDCICDYSELLEIKPSDYKKFVNSNKDYQRILANIKSLFLE